MAVDTLEAKAHELIGHLGPNKLAAIVQLLEAMIEEDPGVETEPVTDEDRRRFQEGQAWFAQRSNAHSVSAPPPPLPATPASSLQTAPATAQTPDHPAPPSFQTSVPAHSAPSASPSTPAPAHPSL